MTTDAISHTVLLGIVLAFLVLAALPGLEADLNSPWLILGAAVAGVATVVLTGAIQRSGLVKADAALGLVFPLLFAIAIILISRLTEDVHLDSDAVILGEIGVVWADARSHCLQDCDPVHITPDDPARGDRTPLHELRRTGNRPARPARRSSRSTASTAAATRRPKPGARAW